MTDADTRAVMRERATDRRKKALWALDTSGMAKSGRAPRKATLAEWVVESADDVLALDAELTALREALDDAGTGGDEPMPCCGGPRQPCGCCCGNETKSCPCDADTRAAMRATAQEYAQHSLTYMERWFARQVLALDAEVTALREALARIARGGCRVIHVNEPPGWTCLDSQRDAKEHPEGYAPEFGRSVAAGEHLCDGCIVAAALAAVPAPEEGAEHD